MKLLVAGASEVDAGKTTFAAGLVERTGVDPYKPRAGNDYWYDHDDVLDAADEGRLYGKDARSLAAAAGVGAPEAINPVHRLWLPNPGRGKGLLGREGRAFAVDRVTLDGADQYVVNETVDLPVDVERALPLEGAVAVDSLPAFNDQMAEVHRPALDAVAATIEEREAAIVESYADIARPLTRFVPDAVAVVEPRRCRIYDGRRYASACEVASGSAHEGRLEKRVTHALDLLDPLARVPLPALTKEPRGDLGAVADAYADAYDELLAVV